METTGKTVLVLGAGFTRAFVPGAPLLTDDYGGPDLVRRLQGYPHARRILLQELERNGKGRINLERLLTRLDGGMPYDADRGATAEFSLLAAELWRALVRRVEDAGTGTVHGDDLLALARRCIRDVVTCITFNYDDVLDRALHGAVRDPDRGPADRWHPDAGYGFALPSSATCVHAGEAGTTPSRMRLLKLHGSINWRPKLGARPPYTIDALVHHERWSAALPSRNGLVWDEIERHLAPDRVLVPPVLGAATLASHPILGRLWSLAYGELEEADGVVFLGYSLPPADPAATSLFREACGHLRPSQVQVVNLARSEEDRYQLRAAYRQVFPGLTDDRFDFCDAREWSNRWCRRAGGR